MLEVELSLIFFVAGFLFHRYGYPVVKEKLKERWIEEDYTKKHRGGWGEHKPCPSCGSKTKHRFDCPQNPDNKVETT